MIKHVQKDNKKMLRKIVNLLFMNKKAMAKKKGEKTITASLFTSQLSAGHDPQHGEYA